MGHWNRSCQHVHRGDSSVSHSVSNIGQYHIFNAFENIRVNFYFSEMSRCMMGAVFTAVIWDELVSSSCRPLCNAHDHIWVNAWVALAMSSYRLFISPNRIQHWQNKTMIMSLECIAVTMQESFLDHAFGEFKNRNSKQVFQNGFRGRCLI